MSRPRKQTAPAEMRSTDKEGEDTEDECTLSRDGWNLPHSPAIVSHFQSLHLRCFLFLCVAKRKVGVTPPPYVDESQLFFLIISGTPVCMCVSTCVPACGYCISTDQVELGAETFHGRKKKKSGKGSREWKETQSITHMLMTPVVSNMGQLTQNKEAIRKEQPIWAKMVENTF